MATITVFDGVSPSGERYGPWVDVPESGSYSIVAVGVNFQFSLDGETALSSSKLIQAGSVPQELGFGTWYALSGIPVTQMRADFGGTSGGISGKVVAVSL